MIDKNKLLAWIEAEERLMKDDDYRHGRLAELTYLRIAIKCGDLDFKDNAVNTVSV